MRIEFIPNFCNIFNTGNHSTQIKLRAVDSFPILLGTTLSLSLYIIYIMSTHLIYYMSLPNGHIYDLFFIDRMNIPP